MKADVYDTYAQSKDGHIIHLDVVVEQGTPGDKAFEYAIEFLKEIGEAETSLRQSHCNFCHTEQADTNIQKTIHEKGYYIIQMDGCPNPIA